MPAQDDQREREMILLFNLFVPADRMRSDVDAYLKLDEVDNPLPFELKSTTGNSVSTVRDFGPEHIAKWRDLHWLFAFYNREANQLRHCYYASPADMAAWIKDKERYVRPDMVLAEVAPSLVTDETVTRVLGAGDSFTIADARLIMKNQWRAERYRTSGDLPAGHYSRTHMVELLRERCEYLIRRGATLNNPHIPEQYLIDQSLQPITENHAAQLRTAVAVYVNRLAAGQVAPAEIDPVIAAQASAADTDDATA